MSRANVLVLLAGLALLAAAPLAAGQNTTDHGGNATESGENATRAPPADPGDPAQDAGEATSNATDEADDGADANATPSSPSPQPAPNATADGEAREALEAPAESLPGEPTGLRAQHGLPGTPPQVVEAPAAALAPGATAAGGDGAGPPVEAGPAEVAAGAGLALAAGVATVAVGRVAWQRRGRERAGEPAADGVCFKVVDARSPSPAPDADPVEHPGAPGAAILGRRAARADRLALAEAWFEAAIRLDPTMAFAHEALGRVLDRRGQSEAACEVLERAVELDPGGPHARIAYARALAQSGELGRAVDTLEPLAGHDDALDELVREDERLAPLRDDPRFQARFGV